MFNFLKRKEKRPKDYKEKKEYAQTRNEDLWYQFQQNIMNIKYAIEIGDKELEKDFRKKRKWINQEFDKLRPYL